MTTLAVPSAEVRPAEPDHPLLAGDARLYASTLPVTVRAGSVGLVVRSRREAVALVALLDLAGVGLSFLVALGDAADIGLADVLAYAVHDPGTDLVVAPVEDVAALLIGVPVGGLRGDEHDVPMVAYGPADEGDRQRAPYLSCPPGVVVVPTWARLADVVAVRLSQRLPHGNRVAVVTTPTNPAADVGRRLDEAGLLTASITQHTELRTRLLIPTASNRLGIVTVRSRTSPTRIGPVLRTLAADPGVDAVICATDLRPSRLESLTRVLDEVSRDHPDVPLVRADAGAGPDPVSGHAPSLPTVERAAWALGVLATAAHDSVEPWTSGQDLGRCPAKHRTATPTG